MIRKLGGGILAAIGLVFLGMLIAGIVRTGEVNLIGAVAIGAAGLAAVLAGIKLIRGPNPRSGDGADQA